MVANKIVSITNATFRKFVDFKNKPQVFHKPVSFSINKNERWAIIGDSKLKLMRLLAGEYIVEPSDARQYPELSRGTWPSSVIELLQFSNNNYGKSADGTGNGGFTHLGARYETFKDLEIDIKTKDFITNLSYNSSHAIDQLLFGKLVDSLALRNLENTYINGLSNGQFRRARIARALYRHTKLLLFDDPFLGLDPTASKMVSKVLEDNLQTRNIVIGLRVQDDVPTWIDHIAIVDEQGIVKQGLRDDVQGKLDELVKEHHAEQARKNIALQKRQIASKEKFQARQSQNKLRDEVIIHFDDISVSYFDKKIIENLQWKVLHGEKWHIRGNNGTGKTTILALITLDHPQSWNSSISLYGEKRRTGKTNYFDNNEEIGFTSPELHALFPRQRTVFETIGNGFSVGNYLPLSDPSNEQVERVNQLIENFGFEKDTRFKDLSISDQKVVLFLRAIVKRPKILILDEAFSAMTDDSIEKCKEVVDNWIHGCVLAIGHVDNEIPHCDKYIRLVDPAVGKYEFGICG